MDNILIIAKDFSDTPGGRFRRDGGFSGEEFYEDFLKPRLEDVWNNNNSTLTLDLDGTFGSYGPSFISEIFIRLVDDFKDLKKIDKKLKLKGCYLCRCYPLKRPRY